MLEDARKPASADGLPAVADLSEAGLAAFAERMVDLAAKLSEREQRLLAVLMARALDPIDRARFFAPPTLFSEREEAFVQALLAAE